MAQPVRSLVLFKRHLKTCDIHQSRIAKSARRFFMECECPIWIYGRTPNGDIVPRQSTGFSDPKRAAAARDSLLRQNKDEQVTGPLVAECIKSYLRLRAQDLDEDTL